jgi:hypothetical protein
VADGNRRLEIEGNFLFTREEIPMRHHLMVKGAVDTALNLPYQGPLGDAITLFNGLADGVARPGLRPLHMQYLDTQWRSIDFMPPNMVDTTKLGGLVLAAQ